MQATDYETTSKTSELTGAALDWAVTMIEKPEACDYGVKDWRGQRNQTVKNGEYVYRWHQSWAQGGPIIERERFEFRQARTGMLASYQGGETWFGPTHLVAAMRCYVASKLGETIAIPKELI